MNENKSPRALYFAYGSNLWIKQMNTRCPSSTIIGTATLPRYRWFICSRGFANVAPSADDKCYGVVYSLAEKDIDVLDMYEGVPHDYMRKHLEVQMVDDGRSLEVAVYVDLRLKEGKVRTEYVKRINNGLDDAKEIPEEWVKKYIRPYIPLPV